MRAMTSRMSTGFFASAPNRPSSSSAVVAAARGPSGQLRARLPAERARSARARSRARCASSSARYSARPETLGVHVGAAELLVGRDLAGRGLQQRRPGEEGARAAAHHDHVVGQARSCRRRPPSTSRARRRSPAGRRPTAAPGCRTALPPWTNCSTRYFSRLAPADSTRWTNGSLFSSAICLRAQQLLEAHAAAARRRRCRRRRRRRMTRTPATKPMPAIDAAAGHRVRRRRRCPAASRRASTARGRARRDRAAARRARAAAAGRACRTAAPRFALAARVRASSARQLRDQRRACARGCAANASLRCRARASSAGIGARISRRCSTSRRGGEVKAVERPRVVPPVPTSGQIALGVRRRAVDAQARAGDERRRRREQEHDRRRRPRSRCRAAAAARGPSCRAACSAISGG